MAAADPEVLVYLMDCIDSGLGQDDALAMAKKHWGPRRHWAREDMDERFRALLGLVPELRRRVQINAVNVAAKLLREARV